MARSNRKSPAGSGLYVESMTGFGTGSASIGGYRVDLDIRAVNGRYLSLKIRMSSEYGLLEEDLRALLTPGLGRGNVEVRVDFVAERGAGSVEIDPGQVRAYVRCWRKLARDLNLEGELRLETLSSMPEVFAAPRDRSAARKALPALKMAAAAALEKFQAMRRREGRALAGSLEKHLARLEKIRARIEKLSPKVARAMALRSSERVRKLLGDAGGEGLVPSEDIARETAWLADRSDVTEEMDRLESHIAQFRAALSKGGSIGKRLDFLVQEMHREANTTGSKASDPVISGLVVDAKLHIEKLREQVQNLL